MNLRRTLAAVLLALASATAVWAGQYDTIDYYVQQMIAAAAARDQAGVLTFREQLENQHRPEPGDATQARPFRRQGLEHLAGNRFKEALAAFRQAFIADPSDPEIAHQLSLTYLRLRRLKEAERLAVYALSLAPGQSATWFTLGQVYGQNGDAQRAAGAFANAHQFASDPVALTEQLRQLATTDPADAIRIGALQALQAAPPGTPPTSQANPGIAPAPAVAPQPQPAGNDNLGQRIYRRSLPITCLIVTTRNGKTDNLGSGLLVSSDGLVITNDHVIDKADNLAVKCGERESVAKVRRRGKSPDLALLSTALNSADRFVLNATYSQDLIGRDVFVIGNPYGLEGTFSTGVISGLREIEGVRYIQISAPISPGNSGGPVILHDGTVIGIATMGLKVGQNLNFAIAAVEISAAGFFDPARMKSQPSAGKP